MPPPPVEGVPVAPGVRVAAGIWTRVAGSAPRCGATRASSGRVDPGDCRGVCLVQSAPLVLDAARVRLRPRYGAGVLVRGKRQRFWRRRVQFERVARRAGARGVQSRRAAAAGPRLARLPAAAVVPRRPRDGSVWRQHQLPSAVLRRLDRRQEQRARGAALLQHLRSGRGQPQCPARHRRILCLRRRRGRPRQIQRRVRTRASNVAALRAASRIAFAKMHDTVLQRNTSVEGRLHDLGALAVHGCDAGGGGRLGGRQWVFRAPAGGHAAECHTHEAVARGDALGTRGAGRAARVGAGGRRRAHARRHRRRARARGRPGAADLLRRPSSRSWLAAAAPSLPRPSRNSSASWPPAM